MSDDENLFGSSDDSGDDTDDLIAQSKPKKIATKKVLGKKKKRLQKKSPPKKKQKRDNIPDADNDDDDDGPGLFDDSDDEGDGGDKKKAASSSKPLSKKEKMEALLKKKRQHQSSQEGGGESSEKRSKKKKGEKKNADGTPTEKDYESGDSYNSVEYERTKADNDFIDVDDDDPDAINELYAEQHFDDERPEGEASDDDEEGGKGKKQKKSGGKSRKKGPDALTADDEADESNPIMQAVNKMKKKKRTAKKLSELEDEAKDFLNRMAEAAEIDSKSIEERKPATKKLLMLPEVVEMLTKQGMVRILLDFDLLSECKKWMQPLPNGMLGNVTVRQRLIEVISKMNGENGITSTDLKKSSFGKTVMSLYMHKSETPDMKRQYKKLIEQWSRPIFNKSGNMKDLEHAHASRGAGSGLVGISMQQQRAQQLHSSSVAATAGRARGGGTGRSKDELASIISSGGTGGKETGSRVRVPFSKGFQYTVRPQGQTGNVQDKRRIITTGGKDGDEASKRSNLSKRMIEKSRPKPKNQRSADVSLVGRPVK